MTQVLAKVKMGLINHLPLKRGKGNMTMGKAKIKYYALSRTIDCPIPGEAKHFHQRKINVPS